MCRKVLFLFIWVNYLDGRMFHLIISSLVFICLLQLFYWNNDQAIIFTVMIYYKDSGELKHRSIAIISDNLAHGTVAVHEYQKIFKNLVDRAVCLSHESFHSENLEVVRQILFFNHYPQDLIEKNIKIRIQ